ncbi:hypothetical protein TIFTF001_014939 [Ficus carica]|uniref:Response regulatory domain-containing protein n=1 Tax=Ficus carica TaxID=3494 RepID=A0AA88A0D1_FICCA|nr:hypothetical protein TIFTF001_014939 [Ficus carica]
MAAVGEVLRPNMPEKVELSGESPAELHVLAVDDSLVDRKVIEKLLKISSCKVTAVESGTRALQYLGLDGEKNSVGFNSLKVNLIMTDYSMPGMTGYELLKRIKESSAFREVPVVIMSSENILTRIDRSDVGDRETISLSRPYLPSSYPPTRPMAEPTPPLPPDPRSYAGDHPRLLRCQALAFADECEHPPPPPNSNPIPALPLPNSNLASFGAIEGDDGDVVGVDVSLHEIVDQANTNLGLRRR